MAIPAINVLGNPNVTEGNFQIAIEDLRKSVIGSGKAYDSANTYSQYDTCVSGGIVYYSKINSNTGNTPAVNANWGLVSELIKLIASPTENSLAKVNADGSISNSSVIVDDSGIVGFNGGNEASPSISAGLGISAANGGNNIIYGWLDTSLIDLWAGVTQKTGIHINGQAASGGSYVSINTGGAERVRINASGNLLLQSGTGALGYGTGAGGTVTQLTSKSTSVTLNKPCGKIITASDSIVSGAHVQFFVNNNLVTANDTIVLNLHNAFDGNLYSCRAFPISGGFYVGITNISTVSISEAITFNFALIKGANA